MHSTFKIFIKSVSVVIIFWLAYSCSPKGFNDIIPETKPLVEYENIDLDTASMIIVGDIQPFNKEVRIDTVGDNQYLISLTLYTDFPSALPKFEFHYKYPIKLVHTLWSSRTWSTESEITLANYARLQSDRNVMSAVDYKSQNRITSTIHDQFEGRFTQIDLKQSNDSISFVFNFFNTLAPDAQLLEYKAEIMIDLSPRNYSNTVRDLSQWLLDHENTQAITKIDHSLLPVYSVWYPLDRNIPLENVTYYFDSISAMGFRSILFDDNWQNVVRFDVDKEGNWDPSKIEIVKDFMNKSRDSKMKVSLWYTHPFIGANNYIFERFEGKYLQYRTSSQPVLDIRYPEVREYITNMYASIVEEWDVDGIWFDYLNGYYPNEQIIITDDNGRDFVSVRKALDSLRIYMESELRYIKPELSINQSYVPAGPMHTSNTKTINGFLGTTVLNNVREKMVNNRLLYGDYSPFMEVMGVHPRDPSVDVAKKFQAIMYGNPYLSYFTYTLPDEVNETLKFWIKYWKSNVHYLLESDFKAHRPDLRYPIISAGNEMKQIITVYNRSEPYDLGFFDFEMADIINSSNYPYVSVKGYPTGKVDFISYNHKGVYTDRGTLKFKRDIAVLEIPEGGYVRLIVK